MKLTLTLLNEKTEIEIYFKATLIKTRFATNGKIPRIYKNRT